jgi:hypothetical protein
MTPRAMARECAPLDVARPALPLVSFIDEMDSSAT